MPIVGTFICAVIFFDNFISIHSNTIEKTPAFSKSFVSFKIFSLSLRFFPLNLNFLSAFIIIFNLIILVVSFREKEKELFNSQENLESIKEVTR